MFRSGQQYSTEVFIQIRIYKLKIHEVIGKPKDKEVLLSSVPWGRHNTTRAMLTVSYSNHSQFSKYLGY